MCFSSEYYLSASFILFGAHFEAVANALVSISDHSLVYAFRKFSITVLFTNMQILKFKSQLMIAFSLPSIILMDLLGNKTLL